MNIIKRAWIKYINLPVTVRATLVYLVVSIVQRGLGFITSPIYTRMLAPEEYGKVTVYLSMEQMIGTVAMFCLSAGCFDIGMQDYKQDRNRFSFSLLLLSNIITIITGGALFILYSYIGNMIGISKFLLCIMFAQFMLQPGFTFWTRQQRFEYKYRIPGIVTVGGAIISSIVAVGAILCFPKARVEARIIGAFIPMAIIYIYYWIYVGIEAKFRIKLSYWKFAFRFNLPLIPHYLSAFVLNNSDRLMIAYLVGDAQAGFYGLAYSISAIATMVWTAINSSIVPYVLDKYEKKEYKAVSDTVLPILTVFAGICMMVILVAPELISILGTEDYLEAMYVIPPVMGGVFFQSLYYVFTNVMYYYKKPQYAMYASISTGILNIGLNYIFISLYGYIAAGYTTLVCYFAQAAIDYFVSRKLVGEDIYDMKYLVKLSSIVIIVSIVSNVLYKFLIVRWLLLLIMLGVLLINRNKIVGLLKKK